MREVSGGTLHYRRWQIVRLPLKLNANLTEMPSSSVVGRQYTNSLRDEATSIMGMTSGNDDARHGGVNGRKEGRKGRTAWGYLKRQPSKDRSISFRLFPSSYSLGRTGAASSHVRRGFFSYSTRLFRRKKPPLSYN